jgi:hypothetical protein
MKYFPLAIMVVAFLAFAVFCLWTNHWIFAIFSVLVACGCMEEVAQE